MAASQRYAPLAIGMLAKVMADPTLSASARVVQGPPDFDLATKPGDRIGCDRCGRVSTLLRVVLDETATDPFAMWQAWRAEQERK
jgi:hypothetical protein